jgi:lipoprotein-releasing system permease protein
VSEENQAFPTGLNAVLFLLKRYLLSSWTSRRKRSSSPVGLILPIVGIAVGVCAFTVVLSVMGGFVDGLKKRLLRVESHIEVIVNSGFGRIPADDSLLREVANSSQSIIGVSPFLKTDVILQSNRKPTTAVMIGVASGSAENVMQFSQYFNGINDSFHQLSGEVAPFSEGQQESDPELNGQFPAIFVGKKMLDNLNMEHGDRVTIISTQPDEGLGGLAPAQQPAVVIGSFHTGSLTHDSKVVFADLPIVQRFTDSPDEWSGIQVALENPIDAQEVAREMNRNLERHGLRAKPWTESNKALMKALKLERWGMSFVLYMVILVGCFSITITLVLAVRRKAREMAILRSIGLRRRDLGLLYLCKGGSVGVVGVFFGLLFGLLLLQLISRVPLSIFENAYPGRGLPFLISWADLATVGVSSIVLSVIAAVWPAVEVMRIDPVETLSDRAL